MRGLRKYLTPFAPDQSGAVSVLYEFGGIIVICDAGGCTGNICGFDEPRWFESKSALFSAGLRDMDAILGRDDRLVAKLADAVTKLDAKFAAIIGTPVPAVIGTDYHALKRMTEKKVDLPILTVDTDGMELYDKGEEKAWLELFRVFSGEKEDVIPGNIGIVSGNVLRQKEKMLSVTVWEMGWRMSEPYLMWKNISWWHRRHWKRQNIWSVLMEHRMKSVILWWMNWSQI